MNSSKSSAPKAGYYRISKEMGFQLQMARKRIQVGDKKMSQYDLANEAVVTQATISSMERGDYDTLLSNFISVIGALKVSVADLEDRIRQERADAERKKRAQEEAAKAALAAEAAKRDEEEQAKIKSAVSVVETEGVIPPIEDGYTLVVAPVELAEDLEALDFSFKVGLVVARTKKAVKRKLEEDFERRVEAEVARRMGSVVS